VATSGRRSESGFTLVEVLVAMVLIALAAVGVAALTTVAMQSGAAARGQTSATLLAIQKMEQLLALTWRFHPSGSGLPESDTSSDVSHDPPRSGGAGLTPSPAGTLQASTPGYADYVDGAGRWVGRGGVAPAGAVYLRRWSIQSSPLDPDARVIQVLVRPVAPTTGAADVVLTSVKSRKFS
jgi:prepilin-type N-terminal cleavage/methylation domain-containing protein